MKKRSLLWLFALLLLGGMALAEGEITSKSALNEPGRRIGVGQGSAAEAAVLSEFPEAIVVYYTDNLMAFTAVAQGKLDAYVYDPVQTQLAIDNGLAGVHLLPEFMDTTVKIAVGFSDVSLIPDLKDRLNRFIAEVKADGTLDDMYRRWVLEGNRVMPEIPLSENPRVHLTVGTTGTVPPYSYYEGGGLTGYDIELARRFAAWLGADLSFEMYDFDGIIPAAKAGKVDVIMSNLQYMPERSESIPFSDILYEEKLGILVRGGSGVTPESAAGAEESGSENAPAYAAYNGRRLGVLTGPLMEDVASEYFPDSEVLLFNSYPDCITALLSGKIDAYLGDELGVKAVHAEQPDVGYIHERITENNYSFAFRKDDPQSAALCAELNAFLEQCWADGTMQELDNIWFGTDEDLKVVDMSALDGKNGTIRVVTTSTDPPFSYVKDGKNVGYDVDLVVRFCRERGYALELGDVDFAGRIPAIESGKYDFTTDMNVTPEREEEVLFSAPVCKGGIVLAVRAADLAAADAFVPEYTGFSDLKGKTVSMLTGAPFEELVSSHEPDVRRFTHYNSMPDLILALKSGKTDAILMNNAVSALTVNRNPGLVLFPQKLRESTFGFAFAKGDPGLAAWQAAFDTIPEETVAALWRKWTGADDSAKVLPVQDWPGKNGTVRVAACDTLEPMSYVGGGGQVIGFDIEILLLAARELDVRLEIEGMEFSAVLSAVQSGKAQIGAGSIIVTGERREAVDFLEYYPAAFVLIVRGVKHPAAAGAAEEDASFQAGVISSFSKTFLREDRWKLFADGVLTTLLITLLTILFGTLLGFGVFMLCRNGNPAANLAARFSVWLVQGMPMVVLLMILYYIIFGSVAVSGVAVAVLGFTLTFGAAVFGLLKMGVGAVDGGQYEAAYALGYSNRRTFFRFIFPQALPHVLPAYKGEIVGLIKATSIVGYIAVQDLTKMGDIVRSRTYEAFFPLIAVTVIYFVLEGLVGFLVSRISLGFNPKRRKPADILKGVKSDE